MELAIATSVLLAAGTAAAKPIYITVPRSYATSEKAVLDVAFEGTGPVELRVLKPADLDAFLKSQANLRRAYQAPTTQANPGHALARGLNAVRNPGEVLRMAVDEGYRKSVLGALPPPVLEPSGPISELTEGPPRLVGLPPGMSLVRTEWLNLDLGGNQRGYSVPGFDSWFSSNGRYQERRVTLQPLPAGLYVVQMIQGRVEGQVVLVVTDQTVQVKQTDGEILVRVAGLDQRPKAGAKVALHRAGGKGEAGVTDEKGEVRIKTADPKLLLTVTSGADVAVVDTDFYSTLAIAPDVFLYTDRPIYRPGDEVRFRGVVRQPDSFLARLVTPRKRQVVVELDSTGAKASTRAAVDEFGSFAGNFRLPEGLATGVFRVVARVDDQAHQSEGRVQEYVKPTFYLEMSGDSETVTPGQKLKARVRARRYSGGVPEKTRYEVFLYRTLLDSPAWVDDAGMGGQGSAVTYGSASTTEGKLSVPQRLYSSIEQRDGASGGEDSWATAALFDDKGEAAIEIDVPGLAQGEERLPYRYSLTVRARDDQGTFANASQSYFLAACDVMGALRPSAKVVKQGGKATLALRATTLSGKPFGETDGEIEFRLIAANGDEKSLSRVTLRTGADGIWRGPMPSDRLGAVVASVILKDAKGRTWTGESAAMLVIGEKGEPVSRVANLTLDALEGVLEPGQTAELVALLPDGWGPGLKNAGPLWVTLSGSGIFDTRLVPVDGLTFVHRFKVEKRFGSAVYASLAYPTASGRWEERTVPFRIVPRERTLTVAVTPERVEAKPLGEQALDIRVTDHQGRPVLAQVSVGVVDKAIYALQSEFRPRILDFFYPVGRNNVANFYSAEFQGYGYGETLAKAMSRLPGYAFSAVKPPTRAAKPKEEDTAYWNPGVVTDRDGHARVRFTMPANQTLWTVTAVAADASGRFGEGTNEFASRGGLSLIASAPHFLREGDEAIGSVRVSAGSEVKKAARIDASLVAGGAFGASAKSDSFALAAGSERVVPIRLAAQKAGAGELAVSLKGDERLADRRALPVRPGVVEEMVEVSAWGGGELVLPVAAGARAESVELVLKPGIVEAALANVEDLLQYPYGCIEQLVSTTIPNVALYRTLEKVDALEKLDPESRAMLAEARSRAVQGVDRVLALEIKGGGFTWFAGYSQPNLAMTLIALDGLSYAAEAGLVDAGDPRLVESAAWLAKQDGVPEELEPTRAYVLSRLEGPRHAARVRALLEKLPADDWHAMALAVLAAEHAQVDREPAVQARLAQLVDQSAQAFFKMSDWRPRPELVWAYPLHRIGASAVVAHAASRSKSFDVAQARRRIVEALSDRDALSTFERSTALLHSLWLVERDARAMRAMAPPKIEGASAALVARGAGLAAPVDPATRKIKVASFEGVATLRARVVTPIAEAKPIAEGMSVARSYWVLRENGRRELKPGEKLAQGDEVFVELQLDATSEDRSGRSAYYVVEDAVPAGFVALGEDKEWRGGAWQLPLAHDALKRRALSPERVTFFFEEPTWWSRSPRTIGYVMRAQFEGRFSAPPATIQDMYAPKVRGRSAPALLEVGPSAKPAPMVTGP